MAIPISLKNGACPTPLAIKQGAWEYEGSALLRVHTAWGPRGTSCGILSDILRDILRKHRSAAHYHQEKKRNNPPCASISSHSMRHGAPSLLGVPDMLIQGIPRHASGPLRRITSRVAAWGGRRQMA